MTIADRLRAATVTCDPRTMPVQAILPCRRNGHDCQYLVASDHKEYMRCIYQPPRVPRAYWQYDVPYKEPAQWRNTKYLEGEGPFTTDVERIECDAALFTDLEAKDTTHADK